MKVACLVSGGKDSIYSAFIAQREGHEIACFLTMKSKERDSYMFHTPNIHLTELQAESAGIPIIIQETEGRKEEELEDLKLLIQKAKEKYGVKGIVAGAIGSVYQASRIQKVCLELGLWCFNPLWQTPPEKHLENLLKEKFEIIISSVAAYPLDANWLGRKIDKEAIEELIELSKKYGVSAVAEGGEYESLVVNCPLFKKRIEIEKSRKEYDNHAGVFVVEGARLA